jgi:hypothetical protein
MQYQSTSARALRAATAATAARNPAAVAWTREHGWHESVRAAAAHIVETTRAAVAVDGRAGGAV